MKLNVIENKIYEIRGQKIMLDFDLASLYEVNTGLKPGHQTKFGKFSDRFYVSSYCERMEILVITNCDYNGDKTGSNLTSQIVISSWGGRRSLPYAFTEHGVTMLASMLKSSKARQMNIAIARAFVALRKFALNYKELAEQIKLIMDKQDGVDGQLSQIYDALENLLDKKTDEESKLDKWKNRERIGFKKNN